MKLIKKTFLISLLVFSLSLVFPSKLSAFTCNINNSAQIAGLNNQVGISVQLDGTRVPNDIYSLEYVAGPGNDIVATGALADSNSIVFFMFSADVIKEHVIDSNNKGMVLFQVHSTLSNYPCFTNLHIDDIIKAYEAATGTSLAPPVVPSVVPSVVPLAAPPGGGTVTLPCHTEFDPAGTDTGVETGLGCIPTQPQDLVKWILKYAILMGGGIAFLLSVFGGVSIILAGGNPEKINAGKEIIGSALTGLLFIIFSVFLLRFIGYDILQLPGFSNP